MDADGQRLWQGCDLEHAELIELAQGSAAVFTRGLETGHNQDAVVVAEIAGGRVLLGVADGAGGLPSGAAASAIASRCLHDAATAADATVMAAFDAANASIQALGVGAASTLAAVELDGSTARSYHAGDSVALVTGQRGRIKMLTVAHSPVGYALEAGMISEREAFVHDDRHLVSNMLGSAEMRIEVGPPVDLAPRDTLVIGSDGVFDNLTIAEVAQLVRKGSLMRAARELVLKVEGRMQDAGETTPGKPDDLAFVLYRRHPAR